MKERLLSDHIGTYRLDMTMVTNKNPDRAVISQLI